MDASNQKRVVLLAAVVALIAGLALIPVVASAAGRWSSSEAQDVMMQGGGGTYAENGVTLKRAADKLKVQVKIPTPAPGTYNYPEGSVQGDLEVFTAWAFVFNNPENCTDPCDGDDIGGPANVGVYHVDGRVGWSNTLSLSRWIRVGAPRFGGTHDLANPLTAEVHVAVAPHGAADDTILLAQLTTPLGDPSFWWAALFK